ncbi:MAG: ABC transporter substrate-binding protein [archaeon]|jgi:branched-chain amino acid transport system substrate-binding protein
MNMKLYLPIIIVLILLVGAFFLALNWNNQNNTKITIGVILPLTGELSDQGQSSKNALILASEKINSNGGVNGKQVNFIFEDSQCSPEKAVTAFNKLTEIDGAKVIVGDICSSASLAIAKLADEKKIVLVNAGTIAKDLTKSPYVFRFWFSEEQAAEKIAQKAIAINCNKMSVLYVNNDFGLGFNNVINPSFSSLGGNIVLSQPLNPTESDFKTSFAKSEQLSPDCYFLALYPDGLLLALKQAKELGINKPFFAHGGIIGVGLDIASDKSLLEGVMGPLFLPPSAEFNNSYKTRFGTAPGVTADAAYDSVNALVKVISEKGYDSEQMRIGLASLKDYAGVTGTINMDSNRETNRGLKIQLVKNGAFVDD